MSDLLMCGRVLRLLARRARFQDTHRNAECVHDSG